MIRCAPGAQQCCGKVRARAVAAGLQKMEGRRGRVESPELSLCISCHTVLICGFLMPPIKCWVSKTPERLNALKDAVEKRTGRVIEYFRALGCVASPR